MKITTLEKEILRMIEVVEVTLLSFIPPVGQSLIERMFQIFKKHSRSEISKIEQAKIRLAISSAVESGRPVNVSFLWALGGNSRSRFKFIQQNLNLPRLGDFWAFIWLEMLDRQIKTVYSPGCRFAIVDEISAIKLIPRWSQVQIDERRQALMPIRELLPNVEVHDLPDFNGLSATTSLSEAHPGEIVAILFSRPDLEDSMGSAKAEILYEDFCGNREKDWDRIRLAIPNKLWDEAVATRCEIARINQLRKEVGWVGSEVFGGELYIDGALTSKGRWCPRIWTNTSTSPQHGGTTLQTAKEKFLVGVELESRLVKTHQPIYIDPIEFGSNFQYEPYVFYWEDGGGS